MINNMYNNVLYLFTSTIMSYSSESRSLDIYIDSYAKFSNEIHAYAEHKVDKRFNEKIMQKYISDMDKHRQYGLKLVQVNMASRYANSHSSTLVLDEMLTVLQQKYPYIRFTKHIHDSNTTNSNFYSVPIEYPAICHIGMEIKTF